MSKQFDAKQAALKAYPEDREAAVDFFIGYIGIYIDEIEYENGMTCEEFIFGDEKKSTGNSKSGE